MKISQYIKCEIAKIFGKTFNQMNMFVAFRMVQMEFAGGKVFLLLQQARMEKP